jgi:tetratricopeptide (TPR) repeat protein
MEATKEPAATTFSPPPPGKMAPAGAIRQDPHPGARQLRTLLAGLPADLGPTLRHLLSCRHCLWRLLLVADDEDQGDTGPPAAAKLEPPEAPPPDLRAERISDREAERRLRRERDREAAPAALAELLLLPESDRKPILEIEPRFASPAVAELLLGVAADAARTEPRQAAALARLALAVAERVDRSDFGEQTVLALQLEGWSRLAEARWQSGEIGAAELALGAATLPAEALPIDAPERATYCRVAAALRADEGKPDEALGLLQRAAQICRHHHDHPQLGEVLAEQGCLLVELDPASALAPLRQAAALVDPAVSSWTALRLRQAMALAYAELDQHTTAREILRGSRQLLHEGLDHPLDQLRYAWTEARILERLGEDRKALRLFRAVAAGFARAGRAFEAALALLDGAELLVLVPRRPEELEALQALCARLTKLLPRTPILALILALRLAGREEFPAPRLLHYVRAYLQAVRRHPDLPYTPSRGPVAAVVWDRLAPDERREICQQAGVLGAVASYPAREVGADLRDLLGWSHQELTATEIRWEPETADA